MRQGGVVMCEQLVRTAEVMASAKDAKKRGLDHVAWPEVGLAGQATLATTRGNMNGSDAPPC
jgi:hypothetical protein